MFVEAIEKAGQFTRPVFTIGRRYGSAQVDPGSATLFFVNDAGWAITTRPIAKMILDAGVIEKKYSAFRKEKEAALRSVTFSDELRRLEEKYQYNDKTTAQLKVNFLDCVDRIQSVHCRMHDKADLALIHFDGFTRVHYAGHAVFGDHSEDIRQGRFLCRLGFPFPEFKNFRYDVEKDDIEWTGEGQKTSPRFPSEGMVTRLLGVQGAGAVGIELSTPGMPGQAGGPLFDVRGVVYGMQGGISRLNLGQCIHMEVIKDFLFREGVAFYTESGQVLPPAKASGAVLPGTVPPVSAPKNNLN